MLSDAKKGVPLRANQCAQISARHCNVIRISRAIFRATRGGCRGGQGDHHIKCRAVGRVSEKGCDSPHERTVLLITILSRDLAMRMQTLRRGARGRYSSKTKLSYTYFSTATISAGSQRVPAKDSQAANHRPGPSALLRTHTHTHPAGERDSANRANARATDGKVPKERVEVAMGGIFRLCINK